MKKLLSLFVLAIMLSPSLAFAMPKPVAAPEPISSSLFIAGGVVLLAAKLKKKK